MGGSVYRALRYIYVFRRLKVSNPGQKQVWIRLLKLRNNCNSVLFNLIWIISCKIKFYLIGNA